MPPMTHNAPSAIATVAIELRKDASRRFNQAMSRQADHKLKGDFKQLVRLLPWSKGHTSRLCSVGYSTRLVSHEKQLPTDLYTLYHLTRRA